MRVVLQRVSKANVVVDNNLVSEINTGLLILAGVEDSDSDEDIEWLAKKVVQLRIFNDNEGKMNLSVNDLSGDILLVSQFTLHASTKKGNRPSYIRASKPAHAIEIIDRFKKEIQSQLNGTVKTGIFGADMKVELLNDGPVTIVIDSKNKE